MALTEKETATTEDDVSAFPAGAPNADYAAATKE